VIKYSAAYRALDKLSENDSKRGTNNFELLYAYLINERKASETAQIMHMHRNNVIYRIGKICEMTGLDLSDPDVRLRLMLCYEIYKK
jgi:DNA-binding PucR family transcriptional regulator